MSYEELTDEQTRFASHDAEAFVDACPGAGKTRTIVTRLHKIAGCLPARQGVAVLSFTNSAVEEFKRRSVGAGLEHVLRYPSFVGTFDAFVRYFLVLPFGVPVCSTRPLIVDSWRTLGIEVRLAGRNAFRGPGVPLDYFDAETAAIEPTRIGHPGLRQHVMNHRSDYVSAANRFRRSLHRSGHLSASDARVEAQRHIRDTEWSQALGRALAARFHEVIVDEAQDCNPADIEILSWLRNHGLRVTVVCDPDQAIYEFRDGSPDSLQAFAEQYRNEDRLRLTGNFRSSSPICTLAATLRSRQDPDKPLGEAAASAYPVIVAAYSGGTVPAEIGHVFIMCLQAEAVGLSPGDAVVLAHRHRDAQRAAGDCLRSEMSGTSRIETLARALGEFWSPSATGRSRESAVLKVERLVLELMGYWQADDHHPSRVAERVKIDRRQLRRQALQLLMKLPRECENSDDERTAWLGSAQAEVESLGLALPRRTTVRRFFARPQGSKWALHLEPPAVKPLPCSTIHEAKGKEFEAVCVVLRPDRAPENQTSELFDSWENRTDLEAKRVIYVGVTRARRLVMLAVPAAFGDRCSGILERWQVRHEFVAADGRITQSST